MFVIAGQNLIIGFDLGNEYSQMSYYDEALFEPCSISQKPGEEVFLIPTVLSAKQDMQQWYFGQDAVDVAMEEQIPLLYDFIWKMEEGEPIIYYEKEWEPVEILKKYLQRCLNLVAVQFPEDRIQKLAVTVQHKTKHLCDCLMDALHQLGLDKDRVVVLSHQESYIYYALRQKKELWLNDVGLFDFSRRGLYFYRIFMNRRTTPITVGVEKKDFSDQLSYEMLLQDNGDTDFAYILDGITKNALYKKIVSTIYVTGQGFEGDWHKSVLEGLCVGRRVFLGQNLYTIGACFGAKELSGDSKLSDYLILNEDMVLVDISIKVFSDTRFTPYYLVKAGATWHDVNKEIELIPDNEMELELEVFDVMTQQRTTFFLHVDALQGRPNRTTILGVSLKFLDPKTCVLQVKDKGFGSMFPSTNRIWEKEIHL